MKYIKSYTLFESVDDDSLADTFYNLGAFTALEKAKLQKHKYTKWKITLEFDWTWASQSTWKEGEEILLRWLTVLENNETQDKIVDPSSIEIDEWEKSDFWEDSESDEFDEDGNSPEPNYGHSVYANFIVYVDSSVDEKTLFDWAGDTFGGRTFSAESVEKEGEETPESEKQEQRDIQNQVTNKLHDIMFDTKLSHAEMEQKIDELKERIKKLSEK